MAYHVTHRIAQTEEEAKQIINQFEDNFPPCYGATGEYLKVQNSTDFDVTLKHYDCE